MKGIQAFMSGFRKMKWYWQLWVGLMSFMNGLMPFFFIEALESKIILGIMLINGILMMGLCQLFGFVRLLGLGHILWIPLIIFLSTRLSELNGNMAIWVIGLIAVNGLSLMIDIVDVFRYLKGERDELGV